MSQSQKHADTERDAETVVHRGDSIHRSSREAELDRRVSDQPFLPIFHRKYANPSPLAFSALATSLFLIGIVALGTKGLTSLSIVVSVALGYGSFALLVAGIWEFPTGNTFAATVFTAYSGFLTSLALILSPWAQISTSYTDVSEFQTALALYFFSWMITSIIFTVAAHRSSGGLILFFVLLDFAFLFLGLAYYYPTNTHLLTAGGAFAILSSFVCWYATLGSLLTKESSTFRLPVLLDLAPKEKEL